MDQIQRVQYAKKENERTKGQRSIYIRVVDRPLIIVYNKFYMEY